MSELDWELPPPSLSLPADEVHVWRIGLDRPEEEVLRLRQLLAPDELARADRFHFAHHRARFAVGRGMLRAILGRVLDMEPSRITFRYGDRGKPALADRADPIEFNLSHSAGLGLLAVTRGRRVGIDIEHRRPLTDREPLVARFFSEREQAEFALVPESRKVEAFYHGWTRKEAYIKAIGLGLGMPLDRFAVSLTPGAPAVLWNVADAPEEASRWTLLALDPAPEFQGALAVEGTGWRLRCFQADP